jgi:hypothetical protein
MNILKITVEKNSKGTLANLIRKVYQVDATEVEKGIGVDCVLLVVNHQCKVTIEAGDERGGFIHADDFYETVLETFA